MKRYFMIIFSGTLWMQSCQILYVPTVHNVPLLKEKNEVRLQISPRDYQVAYALTDNVGMIASGMIRNSSGSITADSSIEKKHSSSMTVFEGGVGYFKTFGETKEGVFEVYGGGGGGTMSYFEKDVQTNATTYQFNANLYKYFIQPSIGMSTDILDFAFSLRYVGVQLLRISTSGMSSGVVIKSQFNADNTYHFIEPAFTFRIGWKYVKLHTQTLFSFQFGNRPEEYINHIPFRLNIGLHFNIAPRYRNK